MQIFKLFVPDPKFPIISRRSPDKFFELIIEMTDIVVAESHADFGNVLVRADQKFLSATEFEANQILTGGKSENFFEAMREARNAHVRDFAHLLNGNIFCKVFVDKILATTKRFIEFLLESYFFVRNLRGQNCQ